MLGFWLMTCMNNDILQQVAGFDTARAWLILENKFSSRSRARVIQIKEELNNLKKRIISLLLNMF